MDRLRPDYGAWCADWLLRASEAVRVAKLHEGGRYMAKGRLQLAHRAAAQGDGATMGSGA